MNDPLSHPAPAGGDAPRRPTSTAGTPPTAPTYDGHPTACAVPLWVPVSADGSLRRLVYVAPAQLSQFIDSRGALLPHVRFRAEDFDAGRTIHYDSCGAPAPNPPSRG